jgi:oxysterol-binding protein-related protein 3/6/7
MRNIVMGTKYLEHSGQLVIDNATTGARCILDFKQGGYFATPNLVTGTILSPLGEVVTHLEGKWDDQISLTVDSSHFRVLWRVAPFPNNAPDYYGFTSFGITLNEITSGLERKLPPTDSRNRPDVRALEDGNIDLAEAEKQRLEDRQRERRRMGKDQQPRWFKEVGDEWIYKGGYWETRAKGWKDIDPLW